MVKTPDRRRGDSPRPPVAGEDGGLAGESGFSILETVMALGIVFAVLLGLMSSLDTGVKGVLTGRQRSGATAVAKEVVEKARSVPFDEVGHDIDGTPDATLATDPNIAGTAPNYTYTPEGAAAEPLVASVDPHFPTHAWTETRDGSDFGVTVYVTWNEETFGDDRKRLTVDVTYTPSQYDETVIENVVRVSTFFSRGGDLPGAGDGDGDGGGDDPVCPGCANVVANQSSGSAAVDAGHVTVTGTVAGVDFLSTDVRLPLATGEFTAASTTDGSPLKRSGNGFARSFYSTMELSTGSPSTGGCEVSGTTGVCGGTQATTAVDNDGGSALPVHQVDGPSSVTAASLSADASGTSITTSLAPSTGSVESRTTVESCTTCNPVVGDGDALPSASNTGSSSGMAKVSFIDLGVVDGRLVEMADATATATVDDDPVNSTELVTSTARLQTAALEIFDLGNVLGLSLPLGFTYGAKVEAVDVTATAQVGPTASSPSVSGPAFKVYMWDEGPLGTQSYSSVDITPGTSTSASASASFSVLDTLLGITDTVTITTTVTSGPATTSCDTNCAGSAEARLQNWLVVETNVVIVEAGSTKADLTITANYGSLAAVAGYQAVT